jgi:putative ABC transport system ATP-binding protein
LVEPLLEARGVGRRNRGSEHWLLRDISLNVRAGERLALVGSTGAGKTLLLRSLALLDPIDAGEVLWRSQAIPPGAVPHFRRSVLYVHQRPALVEGTVEENLRYPFSFKANSDRAFDRDQAIEVLKSLGRDDAFLAKSTRDLSGGERQIVALMRALQLRPAILLLDEPTASLDHATVSALEGLVHAWLAEQPSERAWVWVTHNTDQARRLAAEVLEMNAGSLRGA